MYQAEFQELYELIDEDDPQSRAMVLRAEKESDRVKIDDPIRGFTITRGDIKKFYGKTILNRMIKEIRESYNDNISDELFNIMFDICKDRGVAIKSEVTRKAINNKNSNDTRECGYKCGYDEDEDEEQFSELQVQAAPPVIAGDDFFMKLERGIFRNPKFRKIFKGGMFSVYCWLWANIVRKGWKDKEGYPIKKNYYDNGLLAYSASLSRIARDCFLDKDTVKTYLDTMQEKGIIKIEYITPVGKKRGQGVYILGEWQNTEVKIEEKLYLNKVFFK